MCKSVAVHPECIRGCRYDGDLRWHRGETIRANDDAESGEGLLLIREECASLGQIIRRGGAGSDARHHSLPVGRLGIDDFHHLPPDRPSPSNPLFGNQKEDASPSTLFP